MSASLALVIPWFGPDQKGGAESLAWQVATRLGARGHDVEVLTTCSRSFHDDWGRNALRPGASRQDGVTVRRFRVARRDRAAFDAANARLLAVPRARLSPGLAPVDAATAETFARENIRSPELLDHLARGGRRYRALIFLPYLYGTTLEGVGTVPERAWLQPCLHDEVYAYLPQAAGAFAAAHRVLWNSEGEADVGARLYGPAVWAKGAVVGAGVEPPAGASPDAAARRLLERAGARFALHLGRRDPTKNTELLLRAYARHRAARPDTPLRLVLAGPGPAPPGSDAAGVVDLGAVEEISKRALLERCTALVQPSLHESFSFVVVEAWLCARPVVVHAECPATEAAVRASGGGLVAAGEAEWRAAFDRLAEPAQDQALAAMGRAGRAHAREAADWDRVMERYERALGLTGPARARRRPAPGRPRAVHQLLPTLSYGDAIGDHALWLRSWLRGRGYRSEIYCRHLDPRRADVGTPLAPGHVCDRDGLIYHHSIGSEVTRTAVDHDGPKLLVYHNVTPSHFFAPYRPEFAELLAAGRAELSRLAAAFPHSAGDSTWNARELADAGFVSPQVLPLPVDPAAWGDPPDPTWLGRLRDGSANLLFVGRVAPNKRFEHLIAVFAHLLRRVPRARLLLVGDETPGDPYARCLRVLADHLGVAPRVWLTGQLEHAALHACYRTADLFVSMSEHEGFGVPLVEAMWFDVPVLAYRSTAVPETLGEGGLLFREKRWPELAVLIERLLRDADLRGRVLRAQRRRRRALSPGVLEARYATTLERVMAGAAGAGP